MKRLKFLNPFLLVAIVIAVTAFTNINGGKSHTKFKYSKSTLTTYYFKYTGPAAPLFFSDYTNPNNYTLLPNGVTPGLCPYGSVALCAIVCDGAWNGWEIKPIFNNDWWGTKAQLLDYYNFGIAGGALFLRR